MNEYLGQGHVWMLTPKHFNRVKKSKLIHGRHYCKSVPVTLVTMSDSNITHHRIIFSVLWLLFFNFWRFFLSRFVGLQAYWLAMEQTFSVIELKVPQILARYCVSYSQQEEMTEVLTQQARRSHLHCFYAVLWLRWLYQRQMQKDETSEGEVWIKTQTFETFNQPVFVSPHVHSLSHFVCTSF